MTTAPVAGEGPFVDLHLHSTASDGTDPPAVVVRAAHAAGLTALALTDHDTVDGIAEAQETARVLGIRLVPGVELSVYEGTSEMHLLGLHLDDLDEMERQLAVFRSARRARAEEIVRRLNAIGVRITMDDVLAAARGGALGRPHVARALVENGWAMDLRDAFARYLGTGRPGYLDKRRMSIEEALGLVHRCGGIVVFAHPGTDGTNERLADLAARGLDGVEVLHPSHGSDDRARLKALAAHHGLVPSGGSDAHGGSDTVRVVGAMRVPAAWLVAQDERVARSRAQRRVA